MFKTDQTDCDSATVKFFIYIWNKKIFFFSGVGMTIHQQWQQQRQMKQIEKPWESGKSNLKYIGVIFGFNILLFCDWWILDLLWERIFRPSHVKGGWHISLWNNASWYAMLFNIMLISWYAVFSWDFANIFYHFKACIFLPFLCFVIWNLVILKTALMNVVLFMGWRCWWRSQVVIHNMFTEHCSLFSDFR